MKEILAEYIPINAVNQVVSMLSEHPVNMIITPNRTSKHGDFKVIEKGVFQITVNHNLNKYHFLLTLIHEIAHLVTFKKHGRVKPHGKEWKHHFQHLMLPFLHPGIFPDELIPHLAKYFKNPKASTGSAVNLTYALKQYDQKSGKKFIFELEHGSNFIFNNKTFKKGHKRRTRFECIDLNSKRIYLFNQNAEVDLIK